MVSDAFDNSRGIAVGSGMCGKGDQEPAPYGPGSAGTTGLGEGTGGAMGEVGESAEDRMWEAGFGPGPEITLRRAGTGAFCLDVRPRDGGRAGPGVPPGIYPRLEAALSQGPLTELGVPDGPFPLVVRGEGVIATVNRTGRLRIYGGMGEGIEANLRAFEVRDGQVEVSLDLVPGAAVLGLGAKMGRIDRRGRRYRFWNTDNFTHLPDTDPLYAALPQAILVSGGRAVGLALVWGGESIWDVGHDRADELRITTLAGGLRLLVAVGPRPGEVMERLSSLLGRPMMPPLWALGYQQSHWGWGTQAEFERVAGEFRERGLPLDALYMDLDYEERRHALTWDPERFPDPEGYLRRLRETGVRVVALSNGGMPTDDPRYGTLAEQGLLVSDSAGQPVIGDLWGGPTAYTDYFDPRAEDVWREFYRPFLDQGLGGLWNDMNEPSFLRVDGEHTRWHGKTLPDEAVHHGPDGQTYLHREVHNLYALLMNRATYRSLRDLRPGERPFILSRAGFLGVGRYAALWTGDNASWWEHLRATIPTVTGLGLAGVAMAGVDIGGFQGEVSGELLARWTELGSLMPLARNHSHMDFPRQEPYLFGPDVEQACRRALRLRYSLLPTLYSLLYLAHRTGEPVWRPLGYGFPADVRALRVEDEVLVGPDVLLAPVVDPGLDARSVYLPDGTWYRIDPGFERRLCGGGAVLAEAPMATLPVYVRAGGILVSDPEPGDRVRCPDRLDVTVYPGAPGRFTLFEDDGLSFAFETPAQEDDPSGMRRTEIVWEDAGTDPRGTERTPVLGRLHVRRAGNAPGATLRLVLPGFAFGVSEGLRLELAGGGTVGPDGILPDGDLTIDVVRAS